VYWLWLLTIILFVVLHAKLVIHQYEKLAFFFSLILNALAGVLEHLYWFNKMSHP